MECLGNVGFKMENISVLFPNQNDILPGRQSKFNSKLKQSKKHYNSPPSQVNSNQTNPNSRLCGGCWKTSRHCGFVCKICTDDRTVPTGEIYNLININYFQQIKQLLYYSTIIQHWSVYYYILLQPVLDFNKIDGRLQ